MATIIYTVDSANNVAILGNSNANYFTAHDADSANKTITHDAINVGQIYSGSPYYLYYVYRGVLAFNTSSLDDNALIVSAYLTLNTNNPIGRKIYLKSGIPTYPHIPAEAGDYDIDHYSGDGGSCILNTGNQILNLTSVGLSWISQIGLTKFIILSEKDINREAPTGEEYVQFGGFDHPSYVNAKLTIEYYLPTEAPTVETINLACEDRQSTTLTAVGDITGSGDGYTFRGFEYYQYGVGEYDSSMYAVREIGRFHTLGEFRMTLYGLKPSTIYYIRAFAGNVFGIGYGDWILCATTGVQVGSYEIYEEENTATICFYVSEDSGHTWSLKFGPYTTDQADIAINKILVRGSGKKQIKFTTDLLTGLSVSVMCKVDVKI